MVGLDVFEIVVRNYLPQLLAVGHHRLDEELSFVEARVLDRVPLERAEQREPVDRPLQHVLAVRAVLAPGVSERYVPSLVVIVLSSAHPKYPACDVKLLGNA